MEFDLVLPTVLFLTLLAAIYLYPHVSQNVKKSAQLERLSAKQVVGIALAVAVVVAILALLPIDLLPYLVIGSFCLSLGVLTYMAYPRVVAALLLPLSVLASYLMRVSVALAILALLTSLLLSMLVSSMIGWRETMLFVALLIAVDVLHVFITKSMVVYAEKAVAAGLPVGLVVPTFPAKGYVLLGLGDFLIASLLCLQAMERFGKRCALQAATGISIAFAVSYPLLTWMEVGFFPATVIVFAGFLLGLFPTILTPRLS